MVLQKRLGYGFSGYQVPVVPRASRSPRGRGPIKKKFEPKQKLAFEILASVAGKILLESASSSSSGSDNAFKNIGGCDQEDERGFSSTKPCEKETSHENASVSVTEIIYLNQNDCLHKPINFTLDNAKGSENTSFAEKLATVNSRNPYGSSTNKLGGKSVYDSEFAGHIGGLTEQNLEAGQPRIRTCETKYFHFRDGSNDTIDLDRKPAAVICSENKTKGPFVKEAFPRHVLECYDDIKVVCQDNDENSVGCSHLSSIVKSYRELPDITNHRIKNLSTSKCWKVAPTLFRSDGKMKPVYRNGKSSYTRQRSQRFPPLRTRNFFDRRPLSKYNGRFRCEGIIADNHNAVFRGSSAMAGQQASPKCGDCNVKLSIKSFKVPELFIEIPATATVGSLKRTVMEAVSAALGDGLHVGVLLQGKKVKDDSQTLSQTGISQSDKHCSLGFMLEPGNAKNVRSHCTEDPTPISIDTSSRHTNQIMPILGPGTSNVSQVPPAMNVGSIVEADVNSVPRADISIANAMPETQALVTVPSISREALAMVPLHQKSGRAAAFVQRRIRRPFSVAEVEALVKAVEELGTGRWRDVKLLAFENVKHRTYVDLKDKWKTLVHAARISPQQRRGEPVPQELLDRVLVAHAYWSQQHANQVKSTSLRLCL